MDDEKKGRLEKLRGDVAHGIHVLIDIEVTWIGPQIDQALARGEVIEAYRQPGRKAHIFSLSVELTRSFSSRK